MLLLLYVVIFYCLIRYFSNYSTLHRSGLAIFFLIMWTLVNSDLFIYFIFFDDLSIVCDALKRKYKIDLAILWLSFDVFLLLLQCIGLFIASLRQQSSLFLLLIGEKLRCCVLLSTSTSNWLFLFLMMKPDKNVGGSEMIRVLKVIMMFSIYRMIADDIIWLTRK